MFSESTVVVAKAIREAAQGYTSSEPGPPRPRTRDVLRASVEARLFQLGKLAPTEAVVTKCVSLLNERGRASRLSEVDLVESWNTQVDALIREYSLSPELWVDDLSLEFQQRCSVVFGVAHEQVPVLMRIFHGFERSTRFGIFAGILKSPTFTYIHREIREMEGDMEIDDPAEAIRFLLKQTMSQADDPRRG